MLIEPLAAAPLPAAVCDAFLCSATIRMALAHIPCSAPTTRPPIIYLRSSQLTSSTRRRSKSNFPLPYISLFRSLILVTWPSTWPLLHGYSNAAATAA